MQRFAAALVFSMTGASAGKAKVSVQTGASGLPLGLNPVVDKDWDLFAGKVTLGGTYDLADSAFAPKALHVTAKRPGLKAKLSLSDPVSKAPKALVTATVGDLKDGDYAALTVDSKAPTPKLLELMPVTVPATSVVLSPSSGRERGDSTSLQRDFFRARAFREKHPRFETAPRDDRSSENQPKRAERGRERSL